MAETANAARNASASLNDEGQLVVFRLFGEEFGIEIERVKEIVRPPEMTPIPRSPDYVAGICNLRGNVLPVIDTRIRFGIESEEVTDHTRLLVVDASGAMTGLIVDSMSEVMRMNDAQIEPPPAVCRGVDREFLSGVVKVDDGKRLILILNLNEVLSIDAETSHSLEGGDMSQAREEETSIEAVAEEQLVTFRVGEDEYAFDIVKVSEIIKLNEITAVPNVPVFVKGVFTIRNHLLPIIDLRELLGLPSLISERHALIDAAADELNEWIEGLKHALDADRQFSGITAVKETAFGKWLEAYNTSSIEVETIIKRLKRARADLFVSAARVLETRREMREESLDIFNEKTRALHSVVLDILGEFKMAMTQSILSDQRALVVECGSMNIGYLVDWVDEVLRIPRSVIDETPALAASERKELKAVAKLDKGERLIMIMDESALISGETSRMISDIKSTTGKTGEMEKKTGDSMAQEGMEEEHLVTFTINTEEYAIRIMQVQEINRASEITSVPRAPYFVDGMTNLRGNVIPVLNIRKLFGLEDRELDDRSRIIIVDIEGSKTGLRVDQVNEVLRLPRGQIEKTPSIVVSGGANRYMQGVCKINGGRRIVVLLNMEKILDENELRDLNKINEGSEKKTTPIGQDPVKKELKKKKLSGKKKLEIAE
jgi:purine-binding chemotaxis protein CheW